MVITFDKVLITLLTRQQPRCTDDKLLLHQQPHGGGNILSQQQLCRNGRFLFWQLYGHDDLISLQQLPCTDDKLLLYQRPHGGGNILYQQQLCRNGKFLFWQPYGRDDLILHENLNDHATCNSLQEFTVASSKLDHNNTVPVFQSENDPQWMIHHNNYLGHAAEDVGSDCRVIVGTGMELGGAILTSGMLPIENPMDTLFLNYGESVNSTSPPGVCDGDLITDANASKRWWWWWARGLLADESV
ncbi:hypothetical protein Ancab_000645 [Ancistrocladus abbreviatus]